MLNALTCITFICKMEWHSQSRAPKFVMCRIWSILSAQKVHCIVSASIEKKNAIGNTLKNLNLRGKKELKFFYRRQAQELPGMSPKCLELRVSAGFKDSIWRKCSHWLHFSLATGSTSLSWRDIVLLDLQSIREQAGRSGRVFHLQALWRDCAPFLSHH